MMARSSSRGGGAWGRRLLVALCLGAAVVSSAVVDSAEFLAEHNAYRDEVRLRTKGHSRLADVDWGVCILPTAGTGWYMLR